MKLMELLTLINIAFSNYLDHPERLVLSYLGLKYEEIKFISTNITLDLLYDHNPNYENPNKQTLGVGFAYNIDNGIKFKETKEIKIGNKYTKPLLINWFFFNIQNSLSRLLYCMASEIWRR